jgi:hypothetical protein
MDETGIAWETDLKFKFNNVPDYKIAPATEPTKSPDAWKHVQWTDMKNEHFIVWMRYAGLPTFRKLWGRIMDSKAIAEAGITDGEFKDGLEAGSYTMMIENNYDVEPFEG